MPSVSGTVFTSNSVIPNTDVIVQAYDIDLTSKQLLGEVILLPLPLSPRNNTFQISYSSQQYQSAEGRGTADIQVQASTLDGALAAETEIIFNAPDEVTDIRLELFPVENPASEFKRLVTA